MKKNFFLTPLMISQINSFIFSFFIFMPSILTPVKIINNSGISVYILTILLLCISIIINKKNYNLKPVFFIGIIFGIYSFYYFYFNSDCILTIEMLIDFLKLGFIPFYFAVFITDYKQTYKYFYFFSVVNFVIIMGVFLFNSIVYGDYLQGFSSYMSFSNTLLITTIVFFSYYLEKSKKNLLLYLIPFIIVFMFGARGTLLAIISVSFILFLNSKSIKLNKKVVMVFVILLLIVIIFINYNDIFMLLNQLDIESRTIDKLKNFIKYRDLDRLTSGRIQIYSQAIELIKNKPILGGGFGYFINNIPNYPYAHNIFLEILLQFGFVGLAIFLLFLFYIFIKFYKIKNSYVQIIFVILFFSSFTRLLLSGTYWTSINFWASIGIILGFKTNLVDKL